MLPPWLLSCFIDEIKKWSARSLMDDIRRRTHFFCDFHLIEHKISPDLPWIVFQGQSKTSLRLAGDGVHVMTARTDAAKGVAVDAAVSER